MSYHDLNRGVFYLLTLQKDQPTKSSLSQNLLCMYVGVYQPHQLISNNFARLARSNFL